MYIGEIVKRYREERHISLRTFATQCQGGITHGYLAALEAGKNPNTGKPSTPSMQKLEAIARGMGIDIDQLLAMMRDQPAPVPQVPGAMPYSPGRSMVPVIGTVRCGPGGLAFEELQGAEIADVPNPSEYFYLRAAGDSMAPAIEAGDLVLVHVQPEVENGQLAVIIINGEEGTLKRFMRNGDTVVLQSFNQAYQPRVFVGDEINNITIAGRVVETKRKW